MATFYFGATYLGSTDNNWNTIANWFSYPGGYKDPPIPAGQLPAMTDSIIIWSGTLKTIPWAFWSGSNFSTSTPTFDQLHPGQLMTGSFNFTSTCTFGAGGGIIENVVCDGPASLSLSAGGIFNSTFNNATLGNCAVSGSIFNGPLYLQTNNAHLTDCICYGIITQNQQQGIFTRGLYSPTGPALAISHTSGQWRLVYTNATIPPNDPGFVASGGMFIPIVNLTNVPDILLNQLL